MNNDEANEPITIGELFASVLTRKVTDENDDIVYSTSCRPDMLADQWFRLLKETNHFFDILLKHTIQEALITALANWKNQPDWSTKLAAFSDDDAHQEFILKLMMEKRIVESPITLVMSIQDMALALQSDEDFKIEISSVDTDHLLYILMFRLIAVHPDDYMIDGYP